MLIRLDGGSNPSAYQKYLEDGQKIGREKTRDQLDDRITLAGDLGNCVSVCDTLKADEKFYRITVSFAEDHISEETLSAAVDDVVTGIMCAYDESEYTYYAEAHLPKTKTYIDKATGEEIERKPHIHIMIPKVNIKTGERIDPLGYTKHNIQYIDAIQERFNAKYGLLSPKDSPRIDAENLVSILERYGREEFTGNTNKALKIDCISKIYSGEIRDYNQFKAELEKIGTVSVGKRGRPDEYLKVQLHGETKNIRFEGVAFSRDFLDKSVTERQKLISEKLSHTYREAESPRVNSSKYDRLFKNWSEKQAAEIRYFGRDAQANNENWIKYKSLSDAEQLAAINQKMENENVRSDRSTEKTKRSARITQRKPEEAVRAVRLRALRARRLADSEENRDESQFADSAHRSEVLLQQDVSRYVDEYRFGSRDHELRSGANVLRPDARRRSLISTLVKELAERDAVQAESAKSLFQQIKEKIEPARLLAALEQSHGLDASKYTVSGQKIVAGRRSLSASDFMTREMHMKWPEASAYLKNIYKQQVRAEVFELRRATTRERDSARWQNYCAEREQRKNPAARTALDAEIQQMRERLRAELKQFDQQNRGRLRERAKSYAKALANDILR